MVSTAFADGQVTSLLVAMPPAGWYCLRMQGDSKQNPSPATSDDAAPTTPTRADAYRERFRQAQAIAAQIARARAAGGQPTETEAARLVAEFHARGGQVTICPPPNDGPPEERERSKPTKRSPA